MIVTAVLLVLNRCRTSQMFFIFIDHRRALVNNIHFVDHCVELYVVVVVVSSSELLLHSTLLLCLSILVVALVERSRCRNCTFVVYFYFFTKNYFSL